MELKIKNGIKTMKDLKTKLRYSSWKFINNLTSIVGNTNEEYDY